MRNLVGTATKLFCIQFWWTYVSAAHTTASLLRDYRKELEPPLLGSNTLCTTSDCPFVRWSRKSGTVPEPFDTIISMSLIKVLTVDSQRGIFTATVTLDMYWVDLRLAWDILEFPEEQITLNPEDVWLPNIAILNSVGGIYKYTKDTRNGLILVSADGIVSYYTEIAISVTCELTEIDFPFGHNHCDIMFASLGRKGDTINSEISEFYCADTFEAGGAWRVAGVAVTRHQHHDGGVQKRSRRDVRNKRQVEDVRHTTPVRDEENEELLFRVYMEREPLWPAFKIFVPCFVISIFNVACCFMDVENPNRMLLSVLVLLFFVIVQLDVTRLIPMGSLHIARVVLYMNVLFLLMIIQVLKNALIISILMQGNARTVPKWLKKLTRGALSGRFCRQKVPITQDLSEANISAPLYRRQRKSEVIQSELDADKNIKKMLDQELTTRRHGWLEIARICDFYFTVLYTIAMVAAPTFFSIVMLVKDETATPMFKCGGNSDNVTDVFW